MSYRGKSLKALRESKQIQLRRIANETRIGLSYLRDLEEERFDRFPGKFYFSSFTKEYARSLGLDPGEVVTDLQLAYDEWSGECLKSRPTRTLRTSDEGWINRITGFIRRAQEV
jgi:cytoskeletal protein RodZ